MDSRYDFEKETDKEFLREAGKLLQEKVIKLEIEIVQLKLKKNIDEEIKSNLTAELLVLKRRIFDSKQEKKEKLKGKKKKGKTNLVHNQNEHRNDLQKYGDQNLTLSDQEIEYEFDSDICPDCDGKLNEMKNLFEESSEFDVNQTYYILKRHKRKKYKCCDCKKIVTAKGAEKLLPGGKFSVQIAAHVAIDKYEFHLPLERQRLKMEKQGLIVSVKTLFSLTSHLCNLMYELNEMNRLEVLKGLYICVDESPIKYFTDKIQRGYVWSVSNNIGAYYQFEASRSGLVAKELVKDYVGVVMTDGLKSYNVLSEIEEITHAYCWSHMRRYFFDAMEEEDDSLGEVIDLIDSLYEVEHQAQNYEDLKYLRETRSLKIYNDIKSCIKEHESKYLSNSTLGGKAIKYFYNQQEGLEKFLKNEFVPLDNNTAERRQRCPVMGRKNYLYFRSIDGADIGMFFYSLIESCKTNGLNALGYIQDMALRKIRGQELETPFGYAKKLRNEISLKQKSELEKMASGSPH